MSYLMADRANVDDDAITERQARARVDDVARFVVRAVTET
jgi:hypothetical protein